MLFAAVHESESGPKRQTRNVCFRAAVGGTADCQPQGLAALIYEYTPQQRSRMVNPRSRSSK
jgi:hypothetical protein